MKKAVLLLGHGSRAPEANEAMYRVIELLRGGGAYPIVEAAFLELNPPNIQEGIDLCVRQGARKVIMIPYFLHLGAHVQEDLPREMEQARGRHPGLEVVLGPHLGFHPKLAEVVMERIREADGRPGATRPRARSQSL